MTKEEALQAIKLLSALESWAFSTKNLLPDYLHEELHTAMEVLSKIVLEEKP
jgi:chromosome segregation and condensation protein ScpB